MTKKYKIRIPEMSSLYRYSCYTIEISFSDFYNTYRYKLQFMAPNDITAQGMSVNYAKSLITGREEYFVVHYVKHIDKVKSLESLIKDKELITCELKGNR